MRKQTKRKTHVASGVWLGKQHIPMMECARLRNIRREMTVDEIIMLAQPIDEFIESCKKGSADGNQYQSMIDTGYHMLNLLEVLLHKKKLGNSDDEDLAIRQEFTSVHIQTCEWLSDLIYAIGERQRKTGRYGLTADEIHRLQFINRNWTLLLELSDYGDWFVSLERSQKTLRQLRYQAVRDKSQTA